MLRMGIHPPPGEAGSAGGCFGHQHTRFLKDLRSSVSYEHAPRPKPQSRRMLGLPPANRDTTLPGLLNAAPQDHWRRGMATAASTAFAPSVRQSPRVIFSRSPRVCGRVKSIAPRVVRDNMRPPCHLKAWQRVSILPGDDWTLRQRCRFQALRTSPSKPRGSAPGPLDSSAHGRARASQPCQLAVAA